jgi:hypothetical protein
MRSCSIIRRILAASALLLSLSLHARVVVRQAPPLDATLSPEAHLLWNAYDRATYDSAIYIRYNVRRLYPLIADQSGDVLVVMLTRHDGEVGKPITVGPGGMWVTALPEVQTVCRTWSGDLEMRLRQLLGLPPDAIVDHFLVFRTAAANVFRPSPDDNIDTLFPCDTNADGTLPNDCGNAFPAETTAAHYQWMAVASTGLHRVPIGYPWTHLGYTYNWRPGEDRYGASEYVVREGAQVTLVAKMSPRDYCAMK